MERKSTLRFETRDGYSATGFLTDLGKTVSLKVYVDGQRLGNKPVYVGNGEQRVVRGWEVWNSGKNGILEDVRKVDDKSDAVKELKERAEDALKHIDAEKIEGLLRDDFVDDMRQIKGKKNGKQ